MAMMLKVTMTQFNDQILFGLSREVLSNFAQCYFLQNPYAGPVAPELQRDAKIVPHTPYFSAQSSAITLECGNCSLELERVHLEELVKKSVHQFLSSIKLECASIPRVDL